MSWDNENVSDTNLEKLDELTNKLNRCNKNVKLVLDLLQNYTKHLKRKLRLTIKILGMEHTKTKEMYMLQN